MHYSPEPVDPPRTVNVAVTRTRLAYLRGAVDQAGSVDPETVKQLLTMTEQLLGLVDEYQARASDDDTATLRRAAS